MVSNVSTSRCGLEKNTRQLSMLYDAREKVPVSGRSVYSQSLGAAALGIARTEAAVGTTVGG